MARAAPKTVASCLDEVVASEHVHERDERDDRGDCPGELGDQSDVAAEQQVDPDQHNRDWVQDADNSSATLFT
jgi:hypothetical protein